MDYDLKEIIKLVLIKIGDALKKILDAFKDFIKPMFSEIHKYEAPKTKRYSRQMNITPKKNIIHDKRNRMFYCRNNC